MAYVKRLNTVLGAHLLCAGILHIPSLASAQTASLDASTEDGVAVATSEGDGEVQQHPFELGIFGGVLLTPREHSVRRPDKPDLSYNEVAPEFGARVGIYPIRYLGVEAEGSIAPTETEDGERANLFFLRAHLIGQIPTNIVTPFLVVGTGGLFANTDSLGNDTDRTFHFGVGIKKQITPRVGLRLDARDTLTPQQMADSQPHWPEILLGLTVGLGGSKPAPPPPPPPAPVDSDGDGLVDTVDRCPNEPSTAADGCPYGDADGDGFTDDKDECPKESGIAPVGCPDLDPDKDGVKGAADACPDEPGTRADGCPELDADGDGVPLPADKCPDQPETKNEYQDDDGCPDEIPEAIKKFSGVIDGITFALNKAEIRRSSNKLLDQAAAVLNEFPDLNLVITGHTDSRGSQKRNTELSLERAEAVKAYLVGKGIGASRLTTHGAGPESPIATNDTRAGRAQNRRIEFKIANQ